MRKALTGLGGMAVKPKSSRAGSTLTKGLLPDAHAHPAEWAGTCNKQQNLLADFRAEKLTSKDSSHSPSDYDILQAKEQSEPKTNPLGNGGNTTQGNSASQVANDPPTELSEPKTNPLGNGGNTTRGNSVSQVSDDPLTKLSEPKTNPLDNGESTTLGDS